MKFLILLVLAYYVLRRYIRVPIPGPKQKSVRDNKDDDSGFVDYEEIK